MEVKPGSGGGKQYEGQKMHILNFLGETAGGTIPDQNTGALLLTESTERKIGNKK